MNDIPLDRIEQFKVNKYYIYLKDEDWANKGVEQEDKVEHFILELNLRYIKKVDNKDIFECNMVLEEDETKSIFQFKLSYSRSENLIGLFQEYDYYKETRFTDYVYCSLNNSKVYYLSDLIEIIFDKEPIFKNNF